MFVANIYVDVYRSEGEVDEMDINNSSQRESLIYADVPLHMTPFRPRFRSSRTSDRSGQQTPVIADTTKQYTLRRDDRLVERSTGRTFFVQSVDPTQGAFINNSVILELIEYDA